MELNKKNVLFLTRTMKLGGTENVILQLCEILKPQVNKIIVCSCGGVNVEELHKMGINHYIIPDIEEKSLKTFLTTYKVISEIVKKEGITVIHKAVEYDENLSKKYSFANMAEVYVNEISEICK